MEICKNQKKKHAINKYILLFSLFRQSSHVLVLVYYTFVLINKIVLTYSFFLYPSTLFSITADLLFV